MITKNAILKAGVVMGGLALALQVRAQEVAFQVPVNISQNDPAGLQNSGGIPPGTPFNLALEFTVNNPISVSAVGVYDSTIGNNGSGFGAPVQVGIYSENNQNLPVAPVTLPAGVSGTVIGSAQFQTLGSAVTLNPGTYMVIVSGMGSTAAPDWNYYYFQNGVSPTPANPLIFDGDGGALTVGGSYYSITPTFSTPANDPNYTEDFFQDQYAAGTFVYTVVPEPSVSQLALMGVGLFGLIKLGRKFRKTRSSFVA
jgi:PEP-CTERM motif-containing protein